MKGVVVYDSYFGNTKRVAEAIVEQFKAEGHEVELRSVREKHPAPLQGDILFLGSPIRLGSVTGKVKKYLKKLDKAFGRESPWSCSPRS